MNRKVWHEETRMLIMLRRKRNAEIRMRIARRRLHSTGRIMVRLRMETSNTATAATRRTISRIMARSEASRKLDSRWNEFKAAGGVSLRPLFCCESEQTKCS